MTELKRGFHFLFGLKGRLNRSKYWFGVAILCAANVFVFSVLMLAPPAVFFPLFLLLVWNGFAIYGKRLHDLNLSLWLHVIPWLIFILIVILGASVFGNSYEGARLEGGGVDGGAFLGDFLRGLLIIIGAPAVWIIYTLWLGFAPSRNGVGVSDGVVESSSEF